jgi:ABC-2 type transport system permease protein
MIEAFQELRWQLRRTRTAVIALWFGIALFEFIQPIAIKSFGDLNRVMPLLGIVPPAFWSLLNITPDFLSATGLTGFLSLGFTHPIYILLAATAIIWYACRGLAGEMQRGSIQFSLSRPITRAGLYASRVAGVLVVTTLISLAGIAGMIAGIAFSRISGHVAPERWLVTFAACWLLIWAIGGISLLGSAVSDSMGRAVSLAIVVIVISYVIDYFAALWTFIQPLRPFSIFHYFSPSRALAHGVLPTTNVLVLGLAGLACAIAGGILFVRRDLPA